MAQHRFKKSDAKWPEKAYKNQEFLQGPDARLIRVMCEFTEPAARFKHFDIHNTIVFFGSARALPACEAQAALADAEKALADRGSGNGREEAVAAAKAGLTLSRYYEDTVHLARRLAQWSEQLPPRRRFTVCTGGGPGIMEAANRGAAEAGAVNIGLNISLPFEQQPNPYQTSDLAFEFHYFFVRKFWFTYHAKALIVFPGGFGTMDELFELLTLVQTKKTAKYMPIVIYGRAFWEELLNFDALVRWGVIAKEDLDLFRICDSVDEAYTHLTHELTHLYHD